ncbi:hypothetical protein [Micromonospora sp. S-DT3-3-22]|uniref:hypothetical protein n=1 Tax=Micromonospora sp. S-DT3-3-22 TaxID=2755359 RepID=UPI00188EB647|nr:hypothetical protein [Micromonospora sp. S-DT3-3-22]
MDANDLLMSGGIKSIKWKDEPIGYTVIGTIVEQPKVEQMKKFDSEELDFWPSGDPKMQIVVTLQTEMRDPSNAQDDGKRKLHISPRMMKPVREAVQRVNAPGLAIGGRLAVRRTGGTGATGSPFEFAAEYGTPAVDPGSLLGAQSTPQAAPMLAQPAPQAAPASPAAQSLGITQPAAVAIPCPAGMDPTKWAALPEAQQRAILAAMSPAAGQSIPF